MSNLLQAVPSLKKDDYISAAAKSQCPDMANYPYMAKSLNALKALKFKAHRNLTKGELHTGHATLCTEPVACLPAETLGTGESVFE